MSNRITIADILKSACGPLNAHLEEKPGKKRNKYGNKKVEFDGKTFDSQKECNRYIQLRHELNTGEISDLKCQVEYKLSICVYRADFVYQKAGETIVEDVKGFRTATYRLKKKLMLSELGITITEV